MRTAPHVDASQIVDVILRDGTTMRLRAPRREDAPRLMELFRTLSPESLYLRFHGFPQMGPKLVERLLEPDWGERGALLAVVGDHDAETVIGVGEYQRLRDPTSAEAAFAIADAFQGRGIGTRLVEQLAERAASHGIERFVAEVLADNRAMLKVFESLGFDIHRVLSSGAVEVTFPIARTEPYELRRAERDHVAVTASLRPYFDPSSVAVIGASRRRGTIGGELFRNVIAADFQGAAYPVNRNGEAVAGVRGYRSTSEIPDPVDVAVIAVPAAAVLPAAQEALEAGVRALLVVSAGFAEVGSEGRERQDALLALVRAHGARLIGPNCLGIAVPGRGLNATFGSSSAPPGNIGFSAQSGALGIAFLEAAESRGLGLSAFVSIGNKADVSTNDLLEWWEDDSETDAVLLYVESFGNPRRFAALGRRIARAKPLLALKSGTTATGRAAASSHTAALAGSDAAADALFKQAGVTRVQSLEELIDVAALFSRKPQLAGPSVAILTNAGGLGILCADACEAAGLELPALADETVRRLREQLPAEASASNPIDMLGSAGPSVYENALTHLLSDPGVSAVIVLFVPTVSAAAGDVAAAIERAAVDAPSDKPVLAVVMTAEGIPEELRRSERVATFSYPESAARALGRAAERAAWLRRPQGQVPHLDGVDHDAAEQIVQRALATSEDAWLDPASVRALLQAYRVPVVDEVLAATPDAAVGAARRLGFPVVVKVATPGAHKTETKGVHLALATEEAVRHAAESIAGAVVVQPMVSGGAELLAGVVQDPVFGPLVAFGPGGVFAELIGEAAFRIAPLTDVDAAELVSSGKAGRLVAGFRGAPPADREALEDLVLRLGRLGEDVPAMAELDLNPVIALPDRCVAVDARIRVKAPESHARLKSW
jgi:acetyl coenzyme A synthetase (ADP forming)-like protein